MSTSAVEICSNGLLLLGAKPINAFDEGSDRALLVANLWPSMRDAVLRAYPWNCAIRRVVLAADVGSPSFDYTYSYALPGDLLRVLSVGERGEQVGYEIEGRAILTDESPLRLRYIFRNEDVPSYDATLVQALEAYVAMTCAYPITKSATTQKAMSDLYAFKLRQARVTDSLEQPTEEVGDFPLLLGRRM